MKKKKNFVSFHNHGRFVFNKYFKYSSFILICLAPPEEMEEDEDVENEESSDEENYAVSLLSIT